MPRFNADVPAAALAFALFLSLLASSLDARGAGGDNPSPPDPARLRGIVDAVIQPLMAEHGVPGMAVAVTVGGQAHFFNYGFASRESESRVSEATVFELGSVSKVFTATLAAYAQATGRLSLDDTPGRHLPWLKGHAIDRASLLHLGTYTAGGLPLQFPDGVTNDPDGMAGYFREWKADAEPGMQRRYSNPSIGLLGHVAGLALAKGQDGDGRGAFTEALQTRLFPAFGMRQTHVRVPADAMARYAWGYDKAGRPVRVNPGLFADEAYGVKSTSADMVRFMQANIEPAAIRTEPWRRAIEATQVGHFQVGDSAMVQGLGWEQYAYPATREQLLAGNAPGIVMEANPVRRLTPRQQQEAAAGERLFNKTGSTNGFGAYVAFVPSKGVGLVMLANKNYPVQARVEAAFAVLSRVVAMDKP